MSHDMMLNDCGMIELTKCKNKFRQRYS